MAQSTLQLVKLHTEGRLAAGDIVRTPNLGECTVIAIVDARTITVKTADGRYARIEGLDFGRTAELVDHNPVTH